MLLNVGIVEDFCELWGLPKNQINGPSNKSSPSSQSRQKWPESNYSTSNTLYKDKERGERWPGAHDRRTSWQ